MVPRFASGTCGEITPCARPPELRDADINALAQFEVTHAGPVAPQHRLQFKGTLSWRAAMLGHTGSEGSRQDQTGAVAGRCVVRYGQQL